MTSRAYPSQISAKGARAQLVQLLHGCTKERLASFTAAGLARSWNVPEATAAELLAKARQGRLVL